MNKTDRLLAIVLELQRMGHRRAEDLARTFETSKRTIYRDILALCEAGVPIVSTPGRGYSLMEGYFLPPLSFTVEEATLLLLGSDFMAQNFDAQYRASAQAASRKIEGVLPVPLRNEVRSLQKNIRFIITETEQNNAKRIKLQQLRRAIIEQTSVHFYYHARYGKNEPGTNTSRDVDPYGLIHFLGAWHLIAYCHLRQDIRHFRLDRIEELQFLPQKFQRRTDFQMRERTAERTMNVRVLFDHEVARWVRESRFYFVTQEEETSAGLLVTLTIRHESEVLQWLLSWGRRARVLEPESLKQLLAQEAAAMVSNYRCWK